MRLRAHGPNDGGHHQHNNEKRKQYERLVDGYQAALAKLSVDPGNHSLNLETIKLRRQITRMEGPQGDLRLFDRRATTRG